MVLCQCPERGDTHFYLIEDLTDEAKKVCQCPERGDPHFYSAKAQKFVIAHEYVSMP